MGVRENRLRAEYRAINKFRSSVVTWKTVGYNNPPDVYRLSYNLKSIVSLNNGQPKFHTGFEVEVGFPPDYPRGKPDVRLISKPWPFHPNIYRDGRFCLEGTQNWIPGIGVPLDWICLMVGEIIAFQEVNLNSPANNDSRLDQWIRANLRFEGKTKVTNPVDGSQIRLPDVEDAIRWGTKPRKAKRRISFG